MMKIQFKKLNDKAIIPRRSTSGSAGMDLYASEDAYVYKMSEQSKESVKVKTGIAVQIPEGYVGLLIERSSLHGKGVTLANHVGVIDSDYRGEILIAVKAIYDGTHVVKAGQKIAQLVIVPVPELQIEIVESLNESGRGNGGFGSTGS